MRHYAVHGEIGLTTFVREVKFKISFCPRAMICAALYSKRFTAGSSSWIAGRVTRRFRRRAARSKCGQPADMAINNYLRHCYARHTHALAGVECRTHPWSAWVGLGASISIYVPHLSRGACSCRPHVYVYECLPYGTFTCLWLDSGPVWCVSTVLRFSSPLLQLFFGGHKDIHVACEFFSLSFLLSPMKNYDKGWYDLNLLPMNDLSGSE